MDIKIKYTDDVNAQLIIDIAKADYQDNVEKSIRSFRSKASLPGFRMGMVPASLIRKKYGRDIKVEEINKLVSKGMFDFIEGNKLNVLGEPMWSEDQAIQDYDQEESFTYIYDLAIAPAFDVELGKDDKLPYYVLSATDEMVDGQIKQMLSSFGRQEEAEVVEENDMVRGLLTERDGDQAKENGLIKGDAVLLPNYIKDEAEKGRFVGAKKNAVIVFNPYRAYAGNAYELSSFLGVDRKEVETYKDVEFAFEIESISRHKDAEMNEEFFVAAFGEEGSVKDEAGLRELIKKDFKKHMQRDSDFRLIIDLRDHLMNKVGAIQFPDALLKRWLQMRNSDLSAEDIERDYESMLKQLTFNMIKGKLVEKYDVKSDEEDFKAYSVMMTRSQFAQYGMNNVPEEVIDKFATEQLQKEQERERIVERVMEEKLVQTIKPIVSLEEKTVSKEEFEALFNTPDAGDEVTKV